MRLEAWLVREGGGGERGVSLAVGTIVSEKKAINPGEIYQLKVKFINIKWVALATKYTLKARTNNQRMIMDEEIRLLVL